MNGCHQRTIGLQAFKDSGDWNLLPLLFIVNFWNTIIGIKCEGRESNMHNTNKQNCLTVLTYCHSYYYNALVRTENRGNSRKKAIFGTNQSLVIITMHIMLYTHE